jgi:hypothetical protein
MNLNIIKSKLAKHYIRIICIVLIIIIVIFGKYLFNLEA